MDEYADLTIALSRIAEKTFILGLSFKRPGDLTESPPVLAHTNFDKEALLLAELDPENYGKVLRAALFDGPDRAEIRSFYKECLASAATDGLPLRLRVLVDRSAEELDDLRWETLVDLDDNFLAIHQDHPFSRFLYGKDWRRIKLRPLRPEQLKALIVVANPTTLEAGILLPGGHTLTRIKVEDEVERAEMALDKIKADSLASKAAEPGRVTLDNLESKLKEGYDIIYLVCHGAMLRSDHQDPQSPKRPYIWLEKPDGTAARTEAAKLVAVIDHLPEAQKPRLVVLASCQSAGQGAVPAGSKSSDKGELAPLGPLLVDAGIPAVLAMQDNVTMKTVEEMMPVFFEELLVDGRVDRALMEGRWRVRDNDDWWVPVLFLRLSGGQLWYKSGFEEAFDAWDGFVLAVEESNCVPIIGSELMELFAGPSDQLAKTWAEKPSYPLDRRNLKELQLVAQYLAYKQGPGLLRNRLKKYMKERLIERHAAILPGDAGNKSLADLLALIAAQHNQMPSLPYHILASMPFTLYVTANPDTLLEEALRAQNPPRDPLVLYSCWKSELVTEAQRDAHENMPPPTIERPLVYHLFGSVDEPKSLVLTEDDYIDYLMWVSHPGSNQISIPEDLDTAWKESALLFLGFQPDDWNFRVLFRSILNDSRRKVRIFEPPEYPSVAVQLQPGDDNVHPIKARDYLKEYFTANGFKIYWGSASDFLEELWSHWGEEHDV